MIPLAPRGSLEKTIHVDIKGGGGRTFLWIISNCWFVSIPTWGGGGNFYALTDFFYCYTILFIWKKASKLKNIDCLRLGW